MSLFDSSITKYIIKGTGVPGSMLRRDNIEVFDGNKNLIGKMDMTGKMTTPKISLFDSSDTKVLTSRREIRFTQFFLISGSSIFKVKDEKNNQVGIVKTKPFWLTDPPNFVMMDSNSNQVLKMDSVKDYYSYALDPHGSFEINEPNGKKIAKVSVEDEDRKPELGKLYMTLTWTMDVFESSFERKILLGFLISIFSSKYYSSIQP